MFTILFDLDGTLLPMDYDTFEKGYFELLAMKLQPLGLSAEEVVGGVWAGTKAMIANDGGGTNEEVFWKRFGDLFSGRFGDLRGTIAEFYENEYDQAERFCGRSELVPSVIRSLKGLPCRMAVATNPVFPQIALEKRIRWAGLDPGDFALVTSYENSRFCKPKTGYYREILSKLKADPAETVMIGNDTTEDLAAVAAGIRTYIVTDCLIDRKNVPLDGISHGDWNGAYRWIEDAFQKCSEL